MSKLTIDPEFKALIAPLNAQEFEELERSIVRDGCLEPLAVWKTNGTTLLVDGHNRYKICEKHGKKYDIVPVELADRDAARLWIEEHQIARRNLTYDQRAIIWDSIRQRRAKLARAEQLAKAREAKDTQSKKNSPPIYPTTYSYGKVKKTKEKQKSVGAKSTSTGATPKERTREQVAKEACLPESKLRTAQRVRDKAPELAKDVRKGELSLKEANARIKAQASTESESKPREEKSRREKIFDFIEALYRSVDPEVRNRELRVVANKFLEYFSVPEQVAQ